jgi:hypothetical protein
MIDFSNAILRTARNFRVVPYNRLQEVNGHNIDSSILDGNGYGVAVSEQMNTAPLEVDENTALLLLTLQEPGLLPDHILNSINSDVKQQIIDFILSGAIELRDGDHFISGQQAIELVTPNIEQQSIMAVISHQAIRYAEQLLDSHPGTISNKLYHYNIIPFSSRRRREMEDDKAFLNLSKMDNFWTLRDDMEGWYFFQNRQASIQESKAKLYISPLPDALPDALHATAEALKQHSNTSFKVGCGVTGALRPDKLVVYFQSIEHLLTVAAEIEEKICGLPAHCVPFTAAFTQDGLMSWGMDPAIDEYGERKSWRQWIVEKIAIYLSDIKISNQNSCDESWKVVLARLEQEGINANTFRPRQSWINHYS